MAQAWRSLWSENSDRLPEAEPIRHREGLEAQRAQPDVAGDALLNNETSSGFMPS